jgi:pyruvate kinase
VTPRTKILATLGPASASRERIAALAAAGADAFRLNFSHGTAPEHAAKVAAIRAVEADCGRPIAILQDLQGPKIRCGAFAAPGEVTLVAGQTFRLTLDDRPGDATRVGLTLPELIEDVGVGRRLLLRDGLLEVRVSAVEADALVCEVTRGGLLRDHAGINVPDLDLSVPALSAKDRADLAVGVELGVDWVALSFVRTPEDLLDARAELARLGSAARLMAKIEKPGAVTRFEAILAEADGIMVARGDLGVELPPQDVPVLQRRLVARCVEVAKPVVVATQMLESMTANPTPTRAEASDVATAIFELADAVMLSEETAAGSWPVESVAVMESIAEAVEASPEYRALLYRYYDVAEPGVEEAIAHSACRLAQVLSAPAIAACTWSGATARRLAHHRPTARVVAVTPSTAVARGLALSWGVTPRVADVAEGGEPLAAALLAEARAAGVVPPGEPLVLTGAVPFRGPGRTNLLRVERG